MKGEHWDKEVVVNREQRRRQREAPAGSACELRLYEMEDLAAGGSGAAAGLLHPYSPRGKVLWKGHEGMAAALELLEAAEAAVKEQQGEPISWRTGILRLAGNAKQAKAFPSAVERGGGRLQQLSSLQAAQMVPGLDEAALRQRVAQPSGSSGAAVQEEAAALHIRDGVVLHPERYARAVWSACQAAAARRGDGSSAQLVLDRVDSLAQLEASLGWPPDAVVVAAGAAAGCLPELAGLLPLELSQGYTIELQPADGQPGYPETAPSLLGKPYLGVHGGRRLVVGATRRLGLSPQQSLAELGRRITNSQELLAAEQELLPPAAALWPPLQTWQTVCVRSGVRALPPRDALGSLPLLGRIPPHSTCWLVAGLGARGLVYHALLGQLAARAIVSASEHAIPPELLRWRNPSPPTL